MLLDDESAFLGILGPCSNYSVYMAVIYEDKYYHCAISEALAEWAKS